MDNYDFTLDQTIDEFLTTADLNQDSLYDLMVNVWGLPADTIQEIARRHGISYNDIHRMINDEMQRSGSSADQLDLSEIFPLIATGGRKARSADSFQVKPHEYLWKPYIPMNDVTILMAAGGTGKTMFCCWLLAQISKGGWLPEDLRKAEQYNGLTPQPMRGLYISSEDDGSELRGRLEACGANLQNIGILDKVDSLGLVFTEEEFLQTIRDEQPALVVIDPWQAFIGRDVDVSKITHVRPAMQALSVIAEECHCAIILISHVNKKPQGENMNNAAVGSADFVNAARSALTITFSDDDEELDARLLIHSKVNYSAAGVSLKFDITPLGAFAYRGRSEVTRQMIEEAARTHKSIPEMMIQKRNDADIAKLLIEAVCTYANAAKDGEPVIIAYDQFKDDFGEEIFGTKRPSLALQRIARKLKDQNITLEFKTVNNYPKKASYNGKKLNGVEILRKKDKGQA